MMKHTRRIYIRKSPSDPVRTSLRLQVRRGLRKMPLSASTSLARTGLLGIVLTDIALLARSDTFELAVLALGLAPFTVLQLVCTGLLSGTQVLVSHARGAGSALEAHRIWLAASIAALLLGVPGGLLLLASEPLLLLSGQSPALAAAAASVARALAPGLPALLLFVVAQLHLEASGRARTALAIIVAGFAANALADGMQLAGPGAAAVAATTSWIRFAMAAVAMAVAFGLRPAIPRALDLRRTLKHLMRLGLPWATSQGLETLAFHALVLLAGTLGIVTLSAWQLAAYTLALVYTFTLGIGAAASIRVGEALGSGDAPAAVRAARTGLAVNLGAMGGFGLVLVLLREPFAAFFTADPAVEAALISCLPLLSLVFVLDGLMGVLTGILRGFRDRWQTTALHAVGFWGLLVPAAVLGCASGQGGLAALLLALAFGLAGLDLLLAIRLYQLLRAVRGRMPRATSSPALSGS